MNPKQLNNQVIRMKHLVEIGLAGNTKEHLAKYVSLCGECLLLISMDDVELGEKLQNEICQPLYDKQRSFKVSLKS